MGFVGDLFSSGKGMGYEAATADPNQLKQAYVNSEGGLEQQQQFINALNANQPGAIANQAMLGNLLAQNAQGLGPNPAQAQFQENSNRAAAQTAGMIGSQKGISPALAARLIAQQGGDARQNMAGQAATLQAQQQLGAQNNLANFTAQQIGQQQNALNNYTQGSLNQQAGLLGLQGNANSANAGVQAQTAKQQGGLLGGVLGGVGSAIGMAHGGEVPTKNLAFGGDSSGPQSMFAKSLQGMGGEGMEGGSLNSGLSGLIGGIAKAFKGSGSSDDSLVDKSSPLGDFAPGTGAPLVSDNYAGNVMNMHGGMDYASPNYGVNMLNQPAMAKGGRVLQGEAYANQMKPVPGKAGVQGDSLKNDTVPAKLSPGEVIIPRSVMESDDPAKNAAKFVAAVLAKKGRGLPK